MAKGTAKGKTNAFELKASPLQPECKICFIESKHKNWKNYTLIEGFPGMGLVGTISAKYLVERLKFREVGHIESDIFTPIIRIHNGLPVYPSRIYANDEKKLVVLISEQLIPNQHVVTVSNAVVDWIKSEGIKRVISLAGIQTSDKGEGKVYGIAANKESKEALKKYSVDVIEDGITTGITALMLLSLRDSPTIAFSLMGSVEIGADYKAASIITKKLNEVLSLNIEVEPLLKEAKKTEEELVKQLKRVQETKESVENMPEQMGELETPSYT
ncbi:MAG: proteasome assembly chaperone family protein [Candidatus Diapherotrites archaeon]|nr:proteasome assembly chaperone family protein [Candidatus Diapherotrites archaeon]